MNINYALGSTKEQNLDLQVDTLKTAGVDEIHTEVFESVLAIDIDELEV